MNVLILGMLNLYYLSSSLNNFKPAWKTSILLALVTAKHCSDLTVLCTDNHTFFISVILLFFPESGHKTDQLNCLWPEIHIESHANVNLCPVLYLKAYLWHSELFSKKSDGSQVSSLMTDNNRQQIPVCAKTISFWGRKVLRTTRAHMSLGTPRVCSICGWYLPGLWGGWCMLVIVLWFSTPPRHCFSMYITTMDEVMDLVQHAVLELSQ